MRQRLQEQDGWNDILSDRNSNAIIATHDTNATSTSLAATRHTETQQSTQNYTDKQPASTISTGNSIHHGHKPS
eukprot:m.85667 g.85667  ORF g.85667 m.85667 type:complete len:74 (-) comp25889_c0_seq1:26-247(-)